MNHKKRYLRRQQAVTGSLAACLFMPLLMQPAAAAELSYTPLLRYGADYATNRRMASENSTDPRAIKPTGSMGNQFSLGVDLAAQNERTKISMQPRFDLWRFLGGADREDLDTENIYLNLDGSHLLTERFAFTLAGKYVYDSLLTTEGGANAIGTGLIDAVQSRRVEHFLSPGVRLFFTDRDTVDLNVSYNDVEYEKNNNTTINGYADYLIRAANGRWSHQVNQTDQFFLTLFASQFRVLGSDFERRTTTDNYGFNAGYTARLWEYWTASVSAGLQYTESENRVSQSTLTPTLADQAGFANNCAALPAGVLYPPLGLVNANNQLIGFSRTCTSAEQNEDIGVLLDLDVTRRFENGLLSVGYNRTIGPTGFGSQQTVDVIDLRGEQALTERWRAYGDFQYSMANYDNRAISGFSERTFYSAGGHLDYKWTEFVTLSGGYYYRSQDYGRSSLSADTHYVMFSISYSGDKKTIYR